jgi:hypothetical protein
MATVVPSYVYDINRCLGGKEWQLESAKYQQSKRSEWQPFRGDRWQPSLGDKRTGVSSVIVGCKASPWVISDQVAAPTVQAIGLVRLYAQH